MVATTSSDEKAKRLQELGAQHVINYRQKPDWSTAAKVFTPGQRGIDIVVDVGGENTLGESVKAVRQDGLVVAAVSGCLPVCMSGCLLACLPACPGARPMS